ncbi:unnamed protein product, partial [Sphagnum troendelagicum]
MYEDNKMRKKLRVRWFHKTNELPCKIPPPAPLAREVFLTSFPQVLSVECVDGLATVLSPEHFEKCLSLLPAEAAPQLHVCSRQLDNSDGLKPFSIHEVKGYWHQQILSSVGLGLSPVASEVDKKFLQYGRNGEKPSVKSKGGKELFSSDHSDERRLKPGNEDVEHLLHFVSNCIDTEGELKEEASSAAPQETGCELFPRKSSMPQEAPIKRHVFFEVGDRVEMLCQDSGLRGCWFKGVVTRRVSRRLKIQYEELQNEDGEGNLEEWVSAWRLAGPDKLGVRIVGRTTVRPFPTPCTSADYYIGQAVDVWWNDGWWEGIVVSKEPEGNVKVYFPGEGDISSFHSADLRVSKDWVNGSWVDVHCNYEALNAASLSSLAKNCEHPAAVEKKPYAVFPSSTSALSPTTASLQCDAPSTSASEVDKKFLQYGRNGEKPSVKSKGGKELFSSDHRDERRLRPGNED